MTTWRGIGQVHEWLIAAANAKRKPGQALIAISHAHMAGAASVSEDSERSLIIGNAEALPASLFGPRGHRAMWPWAIYTSRSGSTAKNASAYCGSPIPLSFSEIGYQHQILDVTLKGETLVSVKPLLIPRAVNLQRIGPLPLAEILTHLAALPDIDLLADTQRQPWLEVHVPRRTAARFTPADRNRAAGQVQPPGAHRRRLCRCAQPPRR